MQLGTFSCHRKKVIVSTCSKIKNTRLFLMHQVMEVVSSVQYYISLSKLSELFRSVQNTEKSGLEEVLMFSLKTVKFEMPAY